MLRYCQLVLVVAVNVRIWQQFWLSLLKVTDKFVTHLFVLKVRIGILGLHVVCIEDGRTVLDLFKQELAIEQLLVQALVTLMNVFSTHISMEYWLIEANFGR